MADERLDNEDLENLQPEDQSATDRIAEEAGQITRELGERPVRDYVRRRTDEYRDRIRDNLDGIRRGKDATQTGAKGVEAATRTGAAAAEGAAGTAAATTGSTAAGAATTGAATQVAGQAAVQTGAKAVSSTGIKAIAGASLNFVAPIVGFIVGWIIGELVLKIPVIGKFLEKVGEWGCKIILMGCQILVVVAMALIGIFIATVMGLASLGHWGSSPTKPIDTAKAEHRNQLELVWCLTTKDSTTLEEPPIKEGEENSENANKDAVQTKTAEVKTNDKELNNPQLTPECVAANAKMVDQALKAIEKQVAYFEQIKPKNLEALKKAYDELKKQGQVIKDAGSDLNEARAGTEKFTTTYKDLQAELSKVAVSCDNADLNLGSPTNGGFYQINPNDFPVPFNFTNKMYTTRDMACYLVNLKVKLEAADSRLKLSINQLSDINGIHSGHGNPRAVADVHIPYTHPDISPYDKDLALKAYEVVRSMSPAAVQFIIGCRQSDFPGVVTNWTTNTISDCTYYIHDNHWHIHIPLRN